MIEENPSQQHQQDNGKNPETIALQPAPSAEVPPPPPILPPQQTGSEPTGDPSQNEQAQAVDAIEKDLSKFERRILTATWAGVAAAAITGAFIYSQFKAMTDQNQILSAQSIGAVAGAIESERITREQLRLLREQVKAAQKGVSLRETMAQPIIIPTAGTSINHRERTGEVWVIVRVVNNGSIPAKYVSIAANTRFRDRDPEEIDYKFSNQDFRPAGPMPLLPYSTSQKPADAQGFTQPPRIFPKEYPAYKARKFYIWGYTRYRDTPRSRVHDTQFCRYGTAIFDVSGESYTQTKDCNEK